MRIQGCSAVVLLLSMIWSSGQARAQIEEYRPLPAGTPSESPLPMIETPPSMMTPPSFDNAGYESPEDRRIIIPPPPPPMLRPSPVIPGADPNQPPPRPRAYQPVVPIPDDGLVTTPPTTTPAMNNPPTSSNWGPPRQLRDSGPRMPTTNPPSQPVEPMAQNTSSRMPTGPGNPQPLPAYTPVAQPAPVQPRPVPVVTPTPDPTPASSNVNEDSAVTPPVAPPPDRELLVEKIGPESINLGSNLRYEIHVRNVSTATLFNVRLEDEIPPGSRLIRAEPTPEVRNQRMFWNLGTLEPNAERRYQVELQPGNEGQLQTCAIVTASANSCLSTRVTQPRLALTKTGPETAQVGDEVPFELELSNIGSGPATGVVLRDQLPRGLQHPSGSSIDAEIGTLEPGQKKRVQLRTTAIAPGEHTNQAQVTADNAAPATASATVLVTEPVLLLRKTGPEVRFLNRDAEFDLEVSNPGNAPATNVEVIDQLPRGLDFVSASDNGIYDPATRTVKWTLGALEPGGRRGLKLTLKGIEVGKHLNQAIATADRDLEAQSAAQLRVEGVPAMMLETVDLDDPIELGEEGTYEIRVLNQGSSEVTRVQIIAIVPPGMVPRSGEGPTAYRIQGNQIIFAPLDRLAARADALYRVRVLCREPGDWRFKVQMSCDQLRRPVNEEESTRIYRD